jgi:hypothetical protein
VAGEFSEDARRSEEGEFTGAKEFVSYAVAVTSVINGEREQVTAMRWKCLDTRGTKPEGGGHQRAYRVPPRRAWYGGRNCLLAGAYPWRRAPSVIRST